MTFLAVVFLCPNLETLAVLSGVPFHASPVGSRPCPKPVPSFLPRTTWKHTSPPPFPCSLFFRKIHTHIFKYCPCNQPSHFGNLWRGNPTTKTSVVFPDRAFVCCRSWRKMWKPHVLYHWQIHTYLPTCFSNRASCIYSWALSVRFHVSFYKYTLSGKFSGVQKSVACFSRHVLSPDVTLCASWWGHCPSDANGCLPLLGRSFFWAQGLTDLERPAGVQKLGGQWRQCQELGPQSSVLHRA